MKKLVFVSLIMFTFFYIVEAQLELDENGNVGIGVTPSASYKLYVEGDTKIYDGSLSMKLTSSLIEFNHSSGEGSIDVKLYDDETSFIPGDTDAGYLGNSSRNFYKIYGRYIYQDGSLVTSDLRLKENIRELNSPLDKIMNIRGVQFDFITHDKPTWSENKRAEVESLNKDRIGFIAQELLEVVPELVKYDKEVDEYSVDYLGVIPILVEAMKDQQQEILELQNQISELMNEVPEIKGILSTSVEDLQQDNTANTLFQNSPNPFNEETIIKYFVNDNVGTANIFIYDMSGKQLKNYELHPEGNGEVVIKGGELDSGMYMYTMIADGAIIGSKQMILTD